VSTEDALVVGSGEERRSSSITGAERISVIVPVRNDAARLKRCLKSIVTNQYPRGAIDVLVVDNASTDGSPEAAREWADRVLTLSGTSVAALRNVGVSHTHGEIVAFIDADHEITGEWMAAAVSALADRSVAAVGYPYDTQPNANWVQRIYDAMRDRPASRKAVAWLGSGNLAVRRECFDAIGGFRESLVACEDVDLCNRLIAAGYTIVAEPRMRSTHYGDPASLRAVFFGELWRGRDNLRVTFSGPWTLGHLRSALIPIIDLVCLTASVVALLLGYLSLGALLLLAPLAFVTLRAVLIRRRRRDRQSISIGEAFLFAMVFDAARSLALIVRGSHHARATS
jgi:glycosyltransferase involved in cell wall biosynthesis